MDLDGDAIPDNPWYFGTTSAYPVITDPKTSEPPAANQRTIDHDPDDDNLINVDTLQKLNAIRHDLNGDGLPASTTTYAAYVSAFVGGDLTAATATRMGCVSGCNGYELTRNLDFAADGVAVTSTDAYPNWTPIGGSYAAVFDGKGFTISRLTINLTESGAAGNAGLFNTLANGGVIRDLGMIDASISTGGLYAGALAAFIDTGGEIRTSYAQGGSVVSTALSFVGGLAGNLNGTIRASYSTASVSSTGDGSGVGGLAGSMTNSAIIASYAAGTVAGTGNNSNVGGLVATVSGSGSAITDSYCDTTVNGPSTPCVNTPISGATATAEGKTAAELRAPTGYTGIYANWNIDLDGDGNNDYPWNFGDTQYPALNTPTQRQAAIAAAIAAAADTLPPAPTPHHPPRAGAGIQPGRRPPRNLQQRRVRNGGHLPNPQPRPRNRQPPSGNRDFRLGQLHRPNPAAPIHLGQRPLYGLRNPGPLRCRRWSATAKPPRAGRHRPGANPLPPRRPPPRPSRQPAARLRGLPQR